MPLAQKSQNAEHLLARAFKSFSSAADSLERTYAQLRSQVTHLTEELEVTNCDLAKSLEENRSIRERLRKLVEGLPCGVLVLEQDERIASMNPEAVRLVGSQEAMNTLPALLRDNLRAARETGRELELSLPSQLGVAETDRWVAIRHAWLEQQDCISVFILRDITEMKAMERDRDLLRRRDALAEMSGLLAHEIRNPLGSLELFAGLLAEAELPNENRRWVEHIQAGLRTLSATVNNVLHLHNGSKAAPVELDFGELLDWAYGFLLPLARQAGINLQVMNALRQVFYPADRHCLEQVILNLALNALRFTPTGGWLAIAGEELGDGVLEISVRDSGSGIAPENLARIFEVGFSTQPGSSGLGLAVCRQIVEQHAGKIQVESNPGLGTTFRLRFPRRAGKP